MHSATAKIPRGRVSTYKDIATALGNPHLARAVGNALNKNRDTEKVPCHRVIKSDGSLGGFNQGLKEKIRLLESEGITIRKGKVENYKKILYRPHRI